MNRLAIYLTYDKDGIIDEYIGYMLRELKKSVCRLVVICNEKSVVCGQDYLFDNSDEVFFRDNIGFDAGGFKDAITNLIGWKTIEEYDELLLINDSFYGPFCDMGEIFSESEKKSGDFWGLIKHGESLEFPEHIQSFFLAIRRPMLNSESFHDFWNNMPYLESYYQAVHNYETRFTDYFKKMGYKYFVLANTEVNDSENKKWNQNQYISLQNELIRRRNFPFLKRQIIGKQVLHMNTSENLQLALEYIDKHTQYDVGMIYKNLIRTMDIGVLQETLSLNFIINESCDYAERLDAILILRAQNENAVEDELLMLDNLKDHLNIFVLASDKEICKKYEKAGYKCEIADKNGALEKWLKYYCDHEYICVMHDADISSVNRYASTGKSLLYNYNENLVKSVEHCRGIVDLFNKNKYLGALIPPKAIHASFLSDLRTQWGNEKNDVIEAVKKLGLRCVIKTEKRPLSYSDCIWVRGTVVRSLFEHKADNISVDLKYLWQYIVQDAGYLLGIVQSRRYAEMYETYMKGLLSLLIDSMPNEYQEKMTIEDIDKIVFYGKYQIFKKKYEKIYVYGIGKKAVEYKDIFQNVQGYIVSDGHRDRDTFNNIKVYELSEVQLGQESGVIICVARSAQVEIIDMLKKKEIFGYLCI